MSANFGQLIRHLEMPHILFHDLRHTAATNMHQLTGGFYTVGEILGHTLKGIGMSLGISTNLEAVTAQYVDVRLERKKTVLETYHKALEPRKPDIEKEKGASKQGTTTPFQPLSAKTGTIKRQKLTRVNPWFTRDCFWRRRWDSNPRALADYLISSQARYDHFDTSPINSYAKSCIPRYCIKF